jgi:hypothetical protein
MEHDFRVDVCHQPVLCPGGLLTSQPEPREYWRADIEDCGEALARTPRLGVHAVARN